MRLLSRSTLIGLTLSTSVTTSLPASAFIFNFDSLPNIKTRPYASNNILDFFGPYENNQPDTGLGYTAFFNGDTVFYNFGGTVPLDRGHTEISLNDPAGNFAPYYVTGRPTSIEDGAFTSTRSANLQAKTGFNNFFNVLTNNNISFDKIGFSLGQKTGVDPKKTWNLGADRLGVEWFASPTSTIEERIYQADPNDVELYLTYQNSNGDEVKFVNLGYTPFYSFFDYGATTSPDDTLEAALTEAVPVFLTSGLSDPVGIALANAFLLDVNGSGGKVQLVMDDSGVSDIVPTTGLGGTYGVARLRLPISLHVVSVPEPSVLFALLAFGALGWVSSRRRSI